MLNLGLQMEELIFELADTHLFFNDLEVRQVTWEKAEPHSGGEAAPLSPPTLLQPVCLSGM